MVPGVNDIFHVIVVDSNGCSSKSTDYTFNISSTKNLETELIIQLIVDPKYLQVIFPNEKFIDSRMNLFNATGELVSEMVATKNTELFNIEQLPKGIYILSIRNGDAVKNFKVAVL